MHAPARLIAQNDGRLNLHSSCGASHHVSNANNFACQRNVSFQSTGTAPAASTRFTFLADSGAPTVHKRQHCYSLLQRNKKWVVRFALWAKQFLSAARRGAA
jgi:hypothetical protein